MFMLLVTWFAFNQPPHSYQTAFTTAQACDAARRQLTAEAARIKADSDREVAKLAQQGTLYNPGPQPTVSAICVQR